MDPGELWTGSRPERPAFSVVIPAFNARSTIGSTVESVLRNDVSLEVLVVEDGSPDPVQAHDLPKGPIRLIRRETNGGTARARNRGILEARGRWIGLLDSDDEYETGRMDAAHGLLASDSRLDGLITDTLIVQPDGSSKIYAVTPNREGLLHLRTAFVAGAMILSRKLFETVGMYDPRWPIVEDQDFCLRVLLSGARIGYIPRPAYVYRLNETGKTHTSPPIRGFTEHRNIHLRNSVRTGIPLATRGLLVARALKWERRAMVHRLGRFLGRGWKGTRAGRSA